MKRSTSLRVILTSVLMGLVVPFAQAQQQQFGGISNKITQGTSYHIFATPGEATVEVLVLGGTGQGIYIVGAGTTLDQLLALTGGANMGSSSPDTRTKVTVRLYRQEGNQRTLVYENSMERMVAEPGLYPSLQNGDVFAIEIISRRRLRLRDAFFVFQAAVSVGLLIDRLVTRTRN